MQLLLATRNKGKLREMARALHGLGLHFMTLDRFPDLPEANESGRTFSENALIKARHYHELTLLPCLADDSGLVVDALGGQPGIHSARYAPSDEKRIHKLLLRLRQARRTPSVGRQAPFHLLPLPVQQPFAHRDGRSRRRRDRFRTSRPGWLWIRPCLLLPSTPKDFRAAEPDAEKRVLPSSSGLEAAAPTIVPAAHFGVNFLIRRGRLLTPESRSWDSRS